MTDDQPKAAVITESSNEEVKIEEKAENKAQEIHTAEKKVDKPVEQKAEKPIEPKADTEVVKSKDSAKGSSCLIC